MSRSSSDLYQIPLRTLGRGRRQPVKKYSSSTSLRDDSLAEQGNEDDDRLSTDEAPLIPKQEVYTFLRYRKGYGLINQHKYSSLLDTPASTTSRFPWFGYRRSRGQPRDIILGKRTFANEKYLIV